MKKKILRAETPQIKASAFNSVDALPSTETANDLVSQIASTTAKLQIAEFNEPKGNGRPIKEKAIGRVKFTTSLRGDVVKWLKHYAIDTGETSADVLENAVLFYMDYKKSLKG